MSNPNTSQHEVEHGGGADKTRILIVGGGFAGVEAARYLDRTAAKRANVDVTLVSRENFSLFTPLLHEVVASDLEPADVCTPLRTLLRRVTVLSGEIKTIDLPARRVTLSYGMRELQRELPFDYLVLALGGETNYFGIPGMANHALGIKTLRDAVMLRAGVLAMLEAASVEPDPARRKRMLTFVVVGGGFAGVETVGAINDLARQSLRHYGGIDPRDVRVLLVHGGSVILPELGQALGLYAQEKLRERHVEIKLNTRVSAYADGTVHCDDGEAVPADILVWAGGVSPSPLLKDLPCELQRGRVVVDSTLEVPRFPGVWAVGDCAAISDPTSHHPYPPTAQHAVREGRRAAQNLCARLQGERATPFVYKAPGQLAAIGRRTGVARLFGLKVSGVVGWVLWRTVYLMKLPRLEKKLRVGLRWALDVVFERDLAQYISPRDVASVSRLLETARHPHGALLPDVSAAASQLLVLNEPLCHTTSRGGKPSPRWSMNRYPGKAVLFLVLASLLAFCSCSGQPSTPPPVAPDVAVSPVIQQDVSLYGEWIGTLDGYVNAEIRPQVSGYLIKQTYQEGDVVRKGDVLFEINPRPFQAALAQAQGQLAQAEAQLGKAKLDVERDTPLAKARAIPQRQLDDDLQAKLANEAAVVSARAAVEQAQINLGFTKVTSLVDGIAGIAQMQVGSFVGQTSLLTTVSQVDPIKVYFTVSEQEYLAFNRRFPSDASREAEEKRLQLELMLADGIPYPHKGKFSFADRHVNQGTGTIRIAGLFANPGNMLRPGQYGRIRTVTSITKGAVLVPQRAVTELQGSYQLAVVDPDNTVDIRTVKVGEQVGAQWLIADGLKPGERVIAEGADKVRTGMQVHPTPFVAATAVAER